MAIASNSTHSRGGSSGQDPRHKRPASTPAAPSLSSQSPTIKKSKKATPKTTPPTLKGPETRFKSKMAVDPNVCRSMTFDHTTNDGTKSTTYERNENGLQKLFGSVENKMEQLDRLFGRIVKNFGGEERMKRLMKKLESLADSDDEERVEPAQPEEAEIVTINLSSGEAGDRGVDYQIEIKETFEYIYSDYSTRLATKPDNIYFKNGNQYVYPFNTVEDIGVRNGDRLIVKGVDPTFNTNTYYKQVKIVECRTHDPMTLTMCFRESETILGVYNEWSTFSDHVLGSFSMIYNMRKLKPGTLESNNVRNGATLHCYFNEESEDEAIVGENSASI